MSQEQHDPLAPPPVVALEMVPMDKSYGLTAYRLITDQKIIMENPEFQVFRDEAHAEKHLNKGARAPAGCTRVFKLNDVPYRARRLMPYEIRYGATGYERVHWLVTDTPVIVSNNPKQVVETLKTFQTLPVLTGDGGEELLKDSSLARRSKSKMWGLPCVGLRKTTKKGTERKTPGETIKKQQREWMKERHCLNHRIHVVFLQELSRLIIIERGRDASRDPSQKWDGIFFENRYGYNTKRTSVFMGISFYMPRYARSDPTWKERAQKAAEDADRVRKVVDQVLEWERSEIGWEGDLRSPVVFLRRHRRKEVLTALSLYRPVVKLFYSYPRIDSRKKQSEYDAGPCATSFRGLAIALHKLARAMGCRTYPDLPTTHLTEESLYESV